VTQVRWTVGAVADLQAIHDFIARDSARYATAVCGAIVDTVDRLIAFPLQGRIVPEWQRPELRELLQGAYRIVYRVRSTDVVEILTVFHGARLLRLERDEPGAG
jgi:plasmid stabilization system protein ParE